MTSHALPTYGSTARQDSFNIHTSSEYIVSNGGANHNSKDQVCLVMKKKGEK
jgi:hypothetical protein